MRRSPLFVAAIGALFSGMAAATGAAVVQPQAPYRLSRAFDSTYTITSGYLGKRGPSAAQQKRAARKARNQQRHKAHVRG